MPNAQVAYSKSKVVRPHKGKKKKKKHAQQPTTEYNLMSSSAEAQAIMSLIPGYNMTGKKVVIKEQPVVRTPTTKPPFHVQPPPKEKQVQPSPFSYSPEKYEYKPEPEPEQKDSQRQQWESLGKQVAHIGAYAVAFPIQKGLSSAVKSGVNYTNKIMLGQQLYGDKVDFWEFRKDVDRQQRMTAASQQMEEDYKRWKEEKNFPHRGKDAVEGEATPIPSFSLYKERILKGEYTPETEAERMLVDASKKLMKSREQYLPSVEKPEEAFNKPVPEPVRGDTMVETKVGNKILIHRTDFKDVIEQYNKQKQQNPKKSSFKFTGKDTTLKSGDKVRDVTFKIQDIRGALGSNEWSATQAGQWKDVMSHLENQSRRHFKESWAPETSRVTQSQTEPPARQDISVSTESDLLARPEWSRSGAEEMKTAEYQRAETGTSAQADEREEPQGREITPNPNRPSLTNWRPPQVRQPVTPHQLVESGISSATEMAPEGRVITTRPYVEAAKQKRVAFDVRLKQEKERIGKEPVKPLGWSKGLMMNELEGRPTEATLKMRAPDYGIQVEPSDTHSDLMRKFRDYQTRWQSGGHEFKMAASPSYKAFHEYHQELQKEDLPFAKKQEILQSMASHPIPENDLYAEQAKSYRDQIASQYGVSKEQIRQSMEPVELLPKTPQGVWERTRDIETPWKRYGTKAFMGATRGLASIVDIATQALIPWGIESAFHKWEKKGDEPKTLPLWVQQSMLQHVIPSNYQFSRAAAV